MSATTKKIVLITGGNTGIGWETVKVMLQSSQSYHVFLGSRSLARGEAAAASLRKEVPGTTSIIEVVQVDVESDESINQAYEKVKAGPGYIDVLVNNAGQSLLTNDPPQPRMLTREQAQQWMPRRPGAK